MKNINQWIVDIDNPNFLNKPDLELCFLHCAINHFNCKLRDVGYVYLEEILEYLDIKYTKTNELAHYGWFDNNDIIDMDIEIVKDHNEDPLLYVITFNSKEGLG